MKKVPLDSLPVGNVIAEPMHDRNGRLLVQRNQVLSGEVIEALNRRFEKYVFLGRWDPDFFGGEERKRENLAANCRRTALILEKTLSAEIQKELPAVNAASEKRYGPSLIKSINTELITSRSEGYKQEIFQMRETATRVVGSLFDGMLDGSPKLVIESASAFVEDLVEKIIHDRDILLHLATMMATSERLYTHCFNVSVLSMNIAAALGFDRQGVHDIGLGALMHDVGLSVLPSKILENQSVPTEEEMAKLREHPVCGLYLLHKVETLPRTARFIIYQHHERNDGTGFPKGQEKIFLNRQSRIVAVADIFDSLISGFGTMKKHLPYEAMEALVKMVPDKIIDPDSVRALLQVLSLFPVGSLVLLASGRVGRVIHSNRENYTKPHVSVILEANGDLIETPELLDLTTEADTVVKSLSPDSFTDVRHSDGF